MTLRTTIHMQNHWNLTVFPHWQTIFSSIDQVVSLLESPEKTLQDNSRGMVCLIRHGGQLFVAKRSKRQERHLWAQLTSLYRKGEGARTLSNMAKLYELGLPVPEPVLMLEKTRYGCVVASWSVYRYIEGNTCTCADAPQIADMLKRMHRCGWVHRDPHVKNFLKNDGHLAIIDCAKARPWHSRYVQIYDVVLLNNCCPGSLSLFGVSETDWPYRLAKTRNNLLQYWRKLKRLINPWRYRKRGENFSDDA
jgi:tRNA A-37 threonylcarbamoyl transferase component Bud32